MSLEKGEEKRAEIPKNEIDVLTELVRTLQGEVKTLKSQQLNPQNGINSEDLVQLMARYSAESQKAKDKDYRNGIQAEDIPLEDFDEKGIVFCAPFLGYAIADDRRKGHRILLPYNKETIMFTNPHTRKYQTGKAESLSVFSTYVSYSKKEQAWLREHTYFNTMFYESTKGAISFDAIKAQKLSRIMTSIAHFELPQLINRCKEYNVSIDKDKDVMRTNLALKMAEVELKSEQTQTHKRLMELEEEKEKLMLKK